MKRAGMLLRLAWAPVFLAIGCDSSGFGHLWRDSGKEPSGWSVTSEPIRLDAPTSAPAETAIADGAKPPDEQSTPLAARIDAYVSQFSPDDVGSEAKTGGRSPAPSALPPAATRNDLPLITQVPPATSSTGTVAPTAGPLCQQRPKAGQCPPLAGGPDARGPVLGVANTSIGAEPRTAILTGAESSPLPPEVKPAAALPGPRRPRVELIDVRPVGRPTLPGEHPQLLASANHPAAEFAPAPAPTSLVGLISQLEQAHKLHPKHQDDQLKLRMIYLATGQDDKATGPFEGVDPVQAELLSALCRVMASTRQAVQEPASTTSSALIAVDELRRLLGQQSMVIIPKMALVTQVNSFGDYNAVMPRRFTAGWPVNVFLYTEVSNFRSEPTIDGKLRTLLSERVEIFDATGKVIWQRSEPNIEDRALTPRRDFFIPFPITLPANTPPGEYVLKATIEDKIGATTDQQRMTFTIE